MDQHETTRTAEPTERKAFGRRTVLKGAAWSVPAVVAVGATPAFAATGESFSVVNFGTVNISSANVGTGTLVVSGTGISNSTVTVTLGALAPATTVVSGSWTISIPYSDIAEGVYAVQASDGVSNGNAGTVNKDTVPPALTISATPTIATNKKSFTITGDYGTVVAPTQASSDNAFTAANVTATANGNSIEQTAFTAATGQWSATFGGTSNNDAIVVTATQADGFNNSITPTPTRSFIL